jgi:hypothetical protein
MKTGKRTEGNRIAVEKQGIENETAGANCYEGAHC